MPSLSSPASSTAPAKSTLFCGACGHESPAIDGDWDYRSTSAGAAVRCPDCGTVITVRPSEHQVTHTPVLSADSHAPLPPCTSAGGRLFARWAGFATRWLPLVAPSRGSPAAFGTAWPCDVFRGDRDA